MEFVTILFHFEWMAVYLYNDFIDRDGTAVIEERQYRLLCSVGRFSRLEGLVFVFSTFAFRWNLGAWLVAESAGWLLDHIRLARLYWDILTPDYGTVQAGAVRIQMTAFRGESPRLSA